jgi:hypothetical protein
LTMAPRWLRRFPKVVPTGSNQCSLSGRIANAIHAGLRHAPNVPASGAANVEHVGRAANDARVWTAFWTGWERNAGDPPLAKV